MKNIINLSIALLLLVSTTISGQISDEEIRKFEVGTKYEIETYAENGVLKRKADNAIVQRLNINQKVQGKTPEEMALNYIKSIWSELKFTSAFDQNLVLQKVNKMNSGSVVRYRQYYEGIRVDRNEIVIKINNQNLVRSLQNSTVPIKKGLNIKPKVTEEEAVSTIKRHLQLYKEPLFQKAELVIHIVNLRPILCWEVNMIPNISTHADWQCFVNSENGEIVEARDISCHVDGTGNIFNPSPTNTANVPYGTGGFADNNDDTNNELDAELGGITLLDIEGNAGMFKLKGPFAEITDFQAPSNGLFEQNSSDFSFTRDNEAFEAVMCYYHIDNSMRYINNELGIQVSPVQYTGGVRFDPHAGGFGASFSSSAGTVRFGDGNAGDVDAAEDAVIVLHELGHGIHNWQTGNNHSRNEGLSEGLSDFWGISGTRDCGSSNGYNEWESEFHEVMQWGLMPSIAPQARTTDYTADYCTAIGGQSDNHTSGQWMSTALMRIYSDLGKFKTDQLVIETMPLLISDGTTFGGVNLQETGAFLFQTAIDLNYSDNDLCIIYRHLDDVLCISQPPASVQAPTGNMGNVYMKDTQCDNGDEVNPDNGPMWLSEDIWVRHEDDGSLEHQNPEYKLNSPNYVYVRIRGIGCEQLAGATLQLYFSKASTGLAWPTTWNDFFLMGPNGPVLAGDEITTAPISIPAIEPGEEWITKVE